MTAPQGYPPPGEARRAMAVILLLAILLAMDISLTALLIEPMKRELGLTDVQIGLLQGTAYGIAYGLCSLPMGWMIDRNNRVRLLMVGTLIWAVGMAGSGLAQGYGALIAWRVLLGILAALLTPSSISIICDLYPPERRAVATSIFATGQAGGQALGILAGGLIFEMLGRAASLPVGLTPWRLLYVASGTICVALPLLLYTIQEPRRQEREDRAEAGNGWQSLWSCRGFLGPLIGGMLFAVIAVQAAHIWAAPLLTRKFGLTPGDFAGWLSLVTLAGLIFGALAGGRFAELGRRHGGKTGTLLPAVVASLACVPLSLFAIMPNIQAFAILLSLDLFCAGLIPTVGVIAITLNVPNDIRGRAIGAYVFTVALFAKATAPAAIALISTALGGEDMLGEAVAIVSAPAALAAAGCFMLAIRNKQARL